MIGDLAMLKAILANYFDTFILISQSRKWSDEAIFVCVL
jgi:hypothetical protein